MRPRTFFPRSRLLENILRPHPYSQLSPSISRISPSRPPNRTNLQNILTRYGRRLREMSFSSLNLDGANGSVPR